jgi:hypothetical protein
MFHIIVSKAEFNFLFIFDNITNNSCFASKKFFQLKAHSKLMAAL